MIKAKGEVSSTGGGKPSFFTGEAVGFIQAVNPTKEELIKMKGLEEIADRVQEPTYDVLLKGKEFTKVEFHIKIDPADNGEKGAYPFFVTYPVFLSSDLHISKNGSKCEVIDSHLQTAWIPYSEGKDPAVALKEYVDSGKGGKSAKNIDLKTVRWAKIGESTLYDILITASKYARHNPASGNELEFCFGKSTSPADAHKAFDKIVGGDFSEIKDFVNSDATKYTDSGEPVGIGVFVGVRMYNGRFYHEVLSHPLANCMFRQNGRYRTMEDGVSSRLSKEAYAKLTDTAYPWAHKWDGMKFSEYDIDSAIGHTNENEVVPGSSPEQEDMPF